MKAEFLDSMGNDLAVVNAARVSFNKEVIELGGVDEHLIDYLARNNHWSPFSHVVVKLRETIPIFVARQRFKHTVGFSYNEVSRRYVSDLPEFFTPDTWRGRPVNKKQGSDGVVDGNAYCTSVYNKVIGECELAYEELLALGVAPEQARMVLPQSMMTSYIVTGSLAAWARAYNLRSKEDAQHEIQELATQWASLIRPIAPRSWDALCGNTG